MTTHVEPQQTDGTDFVATVIADKDRIAYQAALKAAKYRATNEAKEAARNHALSWATKRVNACKKTVGIADEAALNATVEWTDAAAFVAIAPIAELAAAVERVKDCAARRAKLLDDAILARAESSAAGYIRAVAYNNLVISQEAKKRNAEQDEARAAKWETARLAGSRAKNVNEWQHARLKALSRAKRRAEWESQQNGTRSEIINSTIERVM